LSVVLNLPSPNASSFSPSTTFQLPSPEDVHGYPNTSPAGTPYSPFETIAALVQSPEGGPRTRLLTWSTAPLAAENDGDTFVVSMMNLPRSWHCGTKVFSSQARSVMTLVAGLPLILALVKSGNCVLEWLPQMVPQVTAALGTPALVASAETARLWSSRVI